MKREIDLRSTTRTDLSPLAARFNSSFIGGSQRNVSDGVEIDAKPFELRQFSAYVSGLPATPPGGNWAWYAAIMVLPKNGLPLWAQVAVHGKNIGAVAMTKAWALPPGTAPVVAWFETSASRAVSKRSSA